MSEAQMTRLSTEKYLTWKFSFIPNGPIGIFCPFHTFTLPFHIIEYKNLPVKSPVDLYTSPESSSRCKMFKMATETRYSARVRMRICISHNFFYLWPITFSFYIVVRVIDSLCLWNKSFDSQKINWLAWSRPTMCRFTRETLQGLIIRVSGCQVLCIGHS